jgi:hypothetical protein
VTHEVSSVMRCIQSLYETLLVVHSLKTCSTLRSLLTYSC